MPELPEVETTRLGLAPHLIGRRITQITLHRRDLRWPIPEQIYALQGAMIHALSRRAKYLLVETDAGTALWHLGMSGSLRILNPETERKLHDHVSWHLDSGMQLRFHDPRRFGCLLYLSPDPPADCAAAEPGISALSLLNVLGPEPLADAFNGADFYRASRNRKQPIKHFLMDQANVTGVGNIYAAESLFQAGVRPNRAAGSLTKLECQRLVLYVKTILASAITQGGTTLRDFVNPDGVPGYFEQALFVYGRAGKPCKRCESVILLAALGNRQSSYCPKCQR